MPESSDCALDVIEEEDVAAAAARVGQEEEEAGCAERCVWEMAVMLGSAKMVGLRMPMSVAIATGPRRRAAKAARSIGSRRLCCWMGGAAMPPDCNNCETKC